MGQSFKFCELQIFYRATPLLATTRATASMAMA
jgi:hypothetical protein